MEMKGLLAVTALSITLALWTADSWAEESCFSGDQSSGTLTFSGAVEESGFSGRFNAFSVNYCMQSGAPADGAIEVQVELASADTENRERDQALKGESFFHVDRYPKAIWTSRAISAEGDGYSASGELELKGIRAAQAVSFTLTPDGDGLLARGEFTMRGSTSIDRQKFEVGTGEFADPEFVRNRVDVGFEIRLVSAK